jgi:hypothetical protein
MLKQKVMDRHRQRAEEIRDVSQGSEVKYFDRRPKCSCRMNRKINVGQ